jgi:flagellar protein FliL
MSATATATVPDKADPKKKKSKKKLIAIVLVLLLAGGGAYMFLGKSKGAAAGPAKVKPPTPGVVVTLDPITLNLAGGHFLKLGMALQATKNAVATPDGAQALDLAVDEFSGRAVDSLTSLKARHKAEAELIAKVSKAYHGDVMDIYFTAFIMQ